MARPAISAFNVRTRPVSGAAIVPTSCAWSTSRAGRRAMVTTSAALSAAESNMPPLNSSVCRVRAASFSALAATAASPVTNASAVGPWSRAFSASAPA